MPFTVTLPKLSPTMEGGVVVKWHKKVGDAIAAGDLLIEVSTDKATVEYQALDKGFLREILVPEGMEAKVNQPIAVCTEKADESVEGYTPEWAGGGAPAAAAPSAAAAPAGAAKPAPAPVRAAPAPVRAAPSKAAALPTHSGPAAPIQQRVPFGSAQGRVQASPYAKKVAAQQNLDLGSVSGTGPGGRVLARDLAAAAPLAPVAFGRRDTPQLAAGSASLEELSPMRKVIGERLLESKTTIPHFYLSMVVDAGPMMTLREQLASWGLKVTVNDLITRATALALRQHPQVNSGFDPHTPAIVRYQTVDISIAVAIPAGLITPIITHADTKHLGQISSEVKELVARAKEGKLHPHEFQGGSFTISNLGMYGVGSFFPIINPPQAAILGVGGVEEVPVVLNGAVVPGKRLHLSLAADHRVIDGAEGAQFLKTLKLFLEHPAGLLVG